MLINDIKQGETPYERDQTAGPQRCVVSQVKSR